VPSFIQWCVCVWDMTHSAVTHSCVWRVSFICVTWPIHTHIASWRIRQNLGIPWRQGANTHTHTHTHSHTHVIATTLVRASRAVSHKESCNTLQHRIWLHLLVQSLIRSPSRSRRMLARDMCMHGWRDSFIRVTWLMHMCGTPHSCAWHDSCTRILRAAVRCDWFVCVMELVHMCDVTRSYVWCDSFNWHLARSHVHESCLSYILVVCHIH